MEDEPDLEALKEEIKKELAATRRLQNDIICILEEKYTQKELSTLTDVLTNLRGEEARISYNDVLLNLGKPALYLIKELLTNYEDLPLHINDMSRLSQSFATWILKTGNRHEKRPSTQE